MIFPDSSRVIYPSNPLAEVICQLRFPQQFEIEETLPVAFQKRISREFPLAETRQDFEFSLSDEVGPSPTKRIVYDFSSRDRMLTVSLTSDFLAVTSRKYRDWAEFRQSVHFVWDAAREVYGIGLLTRVGLRYRNVIDRQNIGLEDAEWHELVRPELLGMLASDVYSNGNIGEVATSQLLSHGNDKIRLNSGLVKSPDGSKVAFLIDSDFYWEGIAEGGAEDDYIQCLEKYNVEAGRLFRWAIKDKLRVRLESEKVRQDN